MTRNLSYFILLISILFFLFIKLPHLSIRLSDTNVYFYTAYNLLNQQLLYKDIFFTNLPLFPYISSLYQFITFGNLKLFYATALIEVIIITSLIFYIVFKKTKNHLISVLSSLLYLFSTIVLIVSDHQTGVFTASIFMLFAYIFMEKKNFLISGGFIALGLLTKAYFLPIILSFIIYLVFRKMDYESLFRYLTGFIFVSTVILLPFLLLAQKEFLTDLLYSTTRGGAEKLEIFQSFILYDFVLFSVLIFNLFNFKKNRLFALMSFLSIVFFFFYQGLYYVYLTFIIPFLAVSFYNLFNFVTSRRLILKIFLPIILSFIILTNIVLYKTSFSNAGEIKNINSIVALIKKENPRYLYGTADITPALAYLGNVPLLDNIVDTNPKASREKIFDSKNLTQKAINSRTIIVAHGTDKQIIDNSPINEIFDKDILLKYCKPLSSIPINTKSEADRINLLKCY